MIRRTLEKHLNRLVMQYSVVTILGPRQSGKTTLCKMAFPQLPYISLENLDERHRIQSDPRQFLEDHKDGVIIDEIQHVPELLSYIQSVVDATKKKGLFILTGSQQFNLMSAITQSLAGRTALLTLLPFSYDEWSKKSDKLSLDTILYKGAFPRIHDENIAPTEAMQFYVSTYVERDVRQLLSVKDLGQFTLFLKLCAAHSGQIVNFSKLGDACGINAQTAKSWLSILETSFVLSIIRPHFNNFKKRMVKSPKFYINDTGLLCYLLDIYSPEHLKNHPLRGAIFETFVITEMIKQTYNSVKKPNLYFFRDSKGFEIDIIEDNGVSQRPIEIKSSLTIHNDMFKSLETYGKMNANSKNPTLLYPGHSSYKVKGIQVMSVFDNGFRSSSRLSP